MTTHHYFVRGLLARAVVQFISRQHSTSDSLLKRTSQYNTLVYQVQLCEKNGGMWAVSTPSPAINKKRCTILCHLYRRSKFVRKEHVLYSMNIQRTNQYIHHPVSAWHWYSDYYSTGVLCYWKQQVLSYFQYLSCWCNFKAWKRTHMHIVSCVCYCVSLQSIDFDTRLLKARRRHPS